LLIIVFHSDPFSEYPCTNRIGSWAEALAAGTNNAATVATVSRTLRICASSLVFALPARRVTAPAEKPLL
jgi:hypothetical protein